MAGARRPPGRPKKTDANPNAAADIRKAAAALFLNGGFYQVSIEDVANACGISRPTLYYHFSSKTDLFYASILWAIDETRSQAQAILKDRSPLYDRLYKFADTRMRQGAPRIDIEILLMEAHPVLTEEQSKDLQRSYRRMIETVADALADAANRGEVQCDDPWLIAQTFITLIRICRNARKHRHPADVVDLLFYGLSPEAAARPSSRARSRRSDSGTYGQDGSLSR